VQQPFGQVAASHPQDPVLVSHDCPAGHALHAAPPVPHCEVDSATSSTQVAPLQQPLGHDVASQPHVPVVVLQL
jgi:hypothetical protein